MKLSWVITHARVIWVIQLPWISHAPELILDAWFCMLCNRTIKHDEKEELNVLLWKCVSLCPIHCWTQHLGEVEHGEFGCAFPTPGWGLGCSEALRHCSGNGEAQTKIWESQSWLWVLRPAMRPGPLGSQTLGHAWATRSNRRAKNGVWAAGWEQHLAWSQGKGELWLVQVGDCP